MKPYLLLMLPVVFFMISCKSQKEQPKAEEPVKEVVEKNEPKFNMTEVAGTYQIYFLEEMAQIEGDRPYITIQESGNVSGLNGCNNFFGRVLTNSKEQTLFDRLGSTRMACEGEKADIERAFMSTMAKIVNVRITGEDGIEFLADDMVVMKGTKVVLKEDFKIITINGDNVSKIGMTFNVSELRMDGNTGCNSFSCQMIQDGFKLDVSEISATELACENFNTKLESEFLSVIQTVNRYDVKENIYSFYEGNKVVFTAIKD